MKIFYVFLMVTLLWVYWIALRRIRKIGGARPSAVLGWLIGLGFFIIVPLTIVVLNDGYTMPYVYLRYGSVSLERGEHLGPILLIWGSLMLTFLFVLGVTSKGKPNSAFRELAVDESLLKRVFLITICISAVDYVVRVVLHGGIENFLASHWYLRQLDLVERYGDPIVLYSRVGQANQVVFSAAAVLLTLWQVKRGRLEWLYSGLMVFFLLLHVIVSGNRIFIALYLISFATSAWLYRRKALLAGFLLVAPFIAVLAVSWIYLRGDLESLADNTALYRERRREAPAISFLMDSFEGKNVMVLIRIVEDFGGRYDYLYGASYARLAVAFVPRSLYPGKPQNLSTQVAELYEPGNITSLSTTALGEMYANFGLLTILGMPLFTGLVMLFDRWFARRYGNNSLFVVMSFLLLIWSVRFPFADSVMVFILSALLAWALQFSRRRTRPAFSTRFEQRRQPVPLPSLASVPGGRGVLRTDR